MSLVLFFFCRVQCGAGFAQLILGVAYRRGVPQPCLFSGEGLQAGGDADAIDLFPRDLGELFHGRDLSTQYLALSAQIS